MKINLPYDSISKLQKLIATKDENIYSSDLFLQYLLNSERYNLAAEYQRRSANAMNKEQLFAAMLAEKLSDKRRGKVRTLVHHLDGRCVILNGDHYLANPFIKNIKIPEKSIGKWRFATDRYAPYQAFAYRDIEVNKGLEEKTHLGFFEVTFSFPVVMQEDRVWMSITPHEIETMQQAINEAQGVVAVMGLGLGYFPFMIAQKESVKKIIIFEKDKEVISLFSQHLLAQFPNKEKITIIEADAVNDFSACVQKSNPNYVFIDVWQGVDDGLPIFVKLKMEERIFPNTRFRYWIEKSLLAMTRRIIITILEEALEGFTENDYQQTDIQLDNIFSDLFYKIAVVKFSNYDDIYYLLTDEGISALLER